MTKMKDCPNFVATRTPFLVYSPNFSILELYPISGKEEQIGLGGNTSKIHQ
jgi:hypothetical protein